MSKNATDVRSVSTCIVTAAAGSIGSATVVRLLAEGKQVLACDANPERLGALEAGLPDSYAGQIESFVGDMTVKTDVERMIEVALSKLGSVDALVSVVGGTKNSGLLEITEAEWDSVIDLNLKSLFLCSQAAARTMIDQGFGRIVSVSSFAKEGVRWFAPLGFSRVHYTAAKAGVAGFTRALAIELGQHGVTANCVVPGPIRLPRSEKMWDRIDTDPEIRPKPLELISLGRYCTANDVAAAIAHLLSPDASYVTGAEHFVTGGL
jgi:NAD(P)-dependent dehydrogenase (short-subunit alcohol dehydrogenase family)